jgi:hypothetical protein
VDFSARLLGYQTLQDPLTPVPIPYRIVPQLVATGIKKTCGFDGRSSASSPTSGTRRSSTGSA